VKRIVNVTTFDRIVMSVFQLLQKHFVILDLLRLAAFLPKLVALVDLVAELVVLELFEKCICS
jgi:hypothetical protein